MTRHKDITRVLLDKWQLDAVRLSLRKANVFFISGSYSIYSPKLRYKWIDFAHTSSWDGELLLPGEIAKKELKREFPDIKRVGWSSQSVKLFSHRFPMFCPGEYRGQFVYIDLVGAYWQIYSRLWLDVAYPGGTGNLDLSPIAGRLRDHKQARNALIGIIRSRNVMAVKGSRSYNLSAKNKYLSPHLWAFIVTWLNEVAYEARECGAIYCMIDGYFFPEFSKWWKFKAFLDEWGIEYRLNHTVGHIRGWGSWDMDFRKSPTKPYQKGSRGKVNFVRQYAGHQTCLTFWKRVLDWRLEKYG